MAELIKINSINLYRDGGTISINVDLFNWETSGWAKNLEIVINNKFGGDGNWYKGWPKNEELISEEFKNKLKKELKNWSDYNSKMVERILKC